MNSKNTSNKEADSNISLAEKATYGETNQTITDSELPKNNKKSKKKLLIISLMVIAFLLLGYLLLISFLSGGIGNVIRGLKSAPNPESPSIVSRRINAINSINDSFEEIDGETRFTNYAESNHDRCYEGQNNSKRTDGYAYRCTYRTTRFYGFNSDFRSEMINFEKKIYGLGWSLPGSDQFPMKDILEDYYDEYYGVNSPKARNYPNGYLVSNLPTPLGGYEKDDSMLYIEYAERESTDLFGIEHIQNVSRDTLFDTFDKKEFQDMQSVVEEITQIDKFVLAVSIQEHYFQN